MDSTQRQVAAEMGRILAGLDDLNTALVKGEDLRLDNWDYFIAEYDRLCASIPEVLRRWALACGQLEMAL